MLTSCDASSLVVDRLCDQASGQSRAVACFYFDFAERKAQSVTSMLGSLPKQIVSKIEKIPEEISLPFQEWKEALSGRKRQLLDIVQMLQPITSSYRRFMCIDALGECADLQGFRLFDSLKQILEKSQRTRIFVTGRSHIRADIERRLSRQVGGGVRKLHKRGFHQIPSS